MRKNITLLLLLTSGLLFSQDVIKLTNGADINVKILANNAETVAYEFNTVGNPYYLVKNEINEIHFGNGTTEKIEHPILTLDEIKEKVIQLVNENALAEKSGRNFKATFEGDYLRMIVLSGNDGSELNDGLLFDFSKVYAFHENSLREENRAYVNIWLDRIRWPERTGRDRMDRIKLIIRVNDHEKAALLLSAFKQLNKALKNK